MSATDQITDRLGGDLAAGLEATVKAARSPRQGVHALWALHRLNRLTDESLRAALSSPDTLIRLHAFPVLRERPADKGYYDMIVILTRLATMSPDADSHLYYTARLTLKLIEARGASSWRPVPAGLQGSVVVALATSPKGKDIVFRKVSDGDLAPRTLNGVARANCC